MSITRDPEESRATAIAGLVLGYAFIGVLKRTGVLDPDAIGNTFEAALLGVENAISPEDRAGAVARQILEVMGRQLATQVKPLAASASRGPRSRPHLSVNPALAPR